MTTQEFADQTYARNGVNAVTMLATAYVANAGEVPEAPVSDSQVSALASALFLGALPEQFVVDATVLINAAVGV